MRKTLWLVSCASAALSACATVPNVKVCTAAGSIASGSICAETITGTKSEMTFEEYLAFLEPTDEHGGAMCMSSSDFGALKTSLEEACRLLGPRCSYEVKQTIKNMQVLP